MTNLALANLPSVIMSRLLRTGPHSPVRDNPVVGVVAPVGLASGQCGLVLNLAFANLDLDSSTTVRAGFGHPSMPGLPIWAVHIAKALLPVWEGGAEDRGCHFSVLLCSRRWGLSVWVVSPRSPPFGGGRGSRLGGSLLRRRSVVNVLLFNSFGS